MIYIIAKDIPETDADERDDPLRWTRAIAWIGTAAEWAALQDATGRGSDRRQRRATPFKVVGMMDGDEAAAEALREELFYWRTDVRPGPLRGHEPFPLVGLGSGRWFIWNIIKEDFGMLPSGRCLGWTGGEPRWLLRAWDGADAALLGIKAPKVNPDAPPPKFSSAGLAGRLPRRPR
jgi:hypothetical protein